MKSFSEGLLWRPLSKTTFNSGIHLCVCVRGMSTNQNCPSGGLVDRTLQDLWSSMIGGYLTADLTCRRIED
jgi:hypothetical protein